jgi:hypothetical protein
MKFSAVRSTMRATPLLRVQRTTHVASGRHNECRTAACWWTAWEDIKERRGCTMPFVWARAGCSSKHVTVDVRCAFFLP